jgi:hypothetical protein
LNDEWKPSGATEEGIVHEIAVCSWREDRLDVYPRAARAKKTWATYLTHSIETGLDLTAVLLRLVRDNVKMLQASFEQVDAPGDIETKVMPAIEDLNTQLEPYLKADGVDPEELLAEGGADLYLALLGDTVRRKCLFASSICGTVSTGGSNV